MFSGVVEDPNSIAPCALLSPETVNERLLHCGLRLAEPAQISSSRLLAANLISPDIADENQLRCVRECSMTSIFVYEQKSEVTGVMAFIPLLECGHRAIVEGRFNPLEIEPSQVCRPGNKISAVYGWGFAAKTTLGGRAVVRAARVLIDDIFPTTPAYARFVSDKGVMAGLRVLGFEPADFVEEGLFWLPGRANLGAVA